MSDSENEIPILTSCQLERLLGAAAISRVPTRLVEEYAGLWLPDPGRGQLWRLAHEGDAALAVVWIPGASTTSVIPVSEDPDYQDAHTVVFDETPLGSSVGVWPSLEVPVPTWVLDRCLGELDTSAIAESRLAFRGRGRGERILDPDGRAWSDVARYRDLFAERFEPFLALTWRDERPTIEGADTLSRLLQSRGIDFRGLASLLGITDPVSALRVWQGRRALTESEASLLARKLGLDRGELRRMSRDIPAGLTAQIRRPIYRPRVQRWASQQNLSEAVARDEIEERVLSRAARSSGNDGDRWQDLLDDFFVIELDDA